MNKFLIKGSGLQMVSVLLPLIFVIGIMAQFASVGQWDFQYGPTPMLKLLLIIPIILIFILIYMLYFSIKYKDQIRSITTSYDKI